jgi:hypothetical protein
VDKFQFNYCSTIPAHRKKHAGLGGYIMSKRVREFVEIDGLKSLDALIERLNEVRSGLPEAAEPEIKLRGDDVFGRRLTICYYRPQTAEEAECEARYADESRMTWGQEFVRQQEVAAAHAGYQGLRRVA